ncbi:MAG TPA: chromate transporter [Candidatus Limnocylindria bacterium]|nr:chromate transporter [Candidatus Limnocylindria bacterium]
MTLGELYRGFFQVGARGFGGSLPWARRMLVEERRWLTAREFTDVFSLCNLLPGPNTLNITVVVGSRFHGRRGALVALAGLMTLPLVVSLTLAMVYTRYGTVPGVDAALRGVGAVAAGLAVAMGLRMAAPLVRRPHTLAFLLVTFAAIAVARWPLLPVVFGLIPLSVLVAWRRHA